MLWVTLKISLNVSKNNCFDFFFSFGYEKSAVFFFNCRILQYIIQYITIYKRYIAHSWQTCTCEKKTRMHRYVWGWRGEKMLIVYCSANDCVLITLLIDHLAQLKSTAGGGKAGEWVLSLCVGVLVCMPWFMPVVRLLPHWPADGYSPYVSRSEKWSTL